MAMLHEGNPPIRDPPVISGPITVTTIDTGQGANEVYPMNQAVRTTDSPSFTAITLGGTTPLTSYIEDTHTASYDSTVWDNLPGPSPPMTFNIRKIGRTVFLEERFF